MRRKSVLDRSVFSGMTMAGSSGGMSGSLIILTIIVLAMAVLTVRNALQGPGDTQTWADSDKPSYFKCTNCGYVTTKTSDEVRNLIRQIKRDPLAPHSGMEMPKFVCPKCGEKTLTKAVKCLNPKCGEIYVFKSKGPGQVDDTCPKCGSSYSVLWAKKKRAEQK